MQGSVIFQISWLKLWITTLVIWMCTVDSVLCVPVMKTTPENINSTVGGIVVLPCYVQNLGNGTINWYFLEHNTQISKGNTILISSRDRYSFVIPLDTSSKQLNLQINNLQISDTGHYRCYVDGKTVSVTHSLRVQGAPPVPDIKPPAANFTDCCIKQNMSPSCLPVCNPSTVDEANFNPLGACAFDLDKLLFCFSNNRSHTGCCRRRFIPDICLDFCLDKPPSLTPQHMQCLNKSNEIIECFEEGQVLLPSTPTEVSVLPVPVSTVLVNWKPPTSNPSAVTGYRVSYKLDSSDVFLTTELIAPNRTQYTLMGLQGNRRYEIYVTAVGHHGSSLPSARHFVTVLDEATVPGQTTDIQGCCRDKGVSPWCRVKLCASSTWSQMNPTSVSSCYAELDTIFHCLAGGRNHTPCCKRSNVPGQCLGLCSGSPPPLDWTFVDCVLNMHIIDACVQEGFKSLPSAPRFLALKEVTNMTAQLEWSAPASGSAGIKNYLVQLRETQRQTEFTSRDQVTTTYIKLTNLKPSTAYEARVITVGDTASSLPSDSVLFLTYDTTYSTTLPPDTGIAIMHNISVCCADRNIPSYCLPGCSYNLGQITTFFNDNALRCINYLSQILICASDGRNHINCCKERYVGSDCQMFCNYTANSPALDIGQITCLGHITSILQCYEEGVTYLPKHPVNIRVTNVTTNTISITWEKAPTGPSIDRYIVAYTPDLITWSKFNISATKFILQNLRKGTKYTIEISAVNTNGTSPPSNRLTVETETGIVLPPPTINGTVVDGRVIWEDRQDCCKNHNVSQECFPLCVGQGASIINSCVGDLASILACTSDGQDHRTCCKRIGVPSGCLSFCQGYITGKNFMTAACMGWTNLISACSLGGANVVPSEPRDFRVEVVANKQVKVRWTVPSKNCHGGNFTCRYHLNYWRVSETDNKTALDGPEATTIQNVTSPYLLKELLSFTHYRITLTAENQYGGSRHTEAQTVFIEYYGIQDLSISLRPDGLIDQGSPVKMFCDAIANPQPTLVWKKDKKVVRTGPKLSILSVKADDSGLYTCEASNKDGKDSVTAFLPVIYKPSVVNHRDATVEPKKGLTAILACWFDGFPDSATVKWWKGTNRVTASPPKIKEFVEFRKHTGVTAVQLRIYNVVGADYGDYSCTAQNKYGRATGAVRLIDPTSPVVPTKPPKPTVANVTACCLQKDVEADCMVACKYDVDIRAIINNTALFKCALHIPAYAECAADGSDHSQCCKKKDVSDYCLPFCSGNVPDGEDILDNPEMLQCVHHADSIIDCMEENRDYVPNAPQVFAKLKDGDIQVTWDPPTKNGDKVARYLVYFHAAGIALSIHSLSSSFRTYKILNVRSHVTYEVWVVAANDFGQSQKSNSVRVSVGGLPPQKPTNVDAEVVSSTKIRLRWSPPADGPNVSGYIIFYKKSTDTNYLQIHTNILSFRLEGLEANSKYEAYVVAQNKDGLSGPSRTVTFTTGGAGEKTPSAQTGPSPTQIGLGIGLTLVVIAIIIVVLLIFYMKFRRGKSGGSTETVSFENPSYGRNQVQISGLPATDMQPSNQFSYGRLEEDQTTFEKEQMEGQYSTLNHESRPELNGNNPATLPVTTDEIHIQSPGKNESLT